MKRRVGLLLCLVLLLTALAPIGARASAADDKIVRVGWYESAFHRTDSLGRRTGYGYEYQQRIATYTGWKYEYVEGSWSELLEKLIAGEIDLLSDVSYTEARAEKILYSSEMMGSEDYHVFISSDNTDISPDNFSTLNGKKVGVNKNSIQEQLFIDWAAQHNVQPEVLEMTQKTPELLDMLRSGEIDALVTLDTYGNQADVVPVYKVGYARSYFGINRNRPDLKQELDVAMSRILEDNRDYNQQLTERFNKASSVSSFLSKDETNWLAGHDVIRIGYQDSYLPFCDTDAETGTVTGMLKDFLDFASTSEKNAVIHFETKGFSTTTDAMNALNAGEIDAVFPIYCSTYDGEQLGVLVSDPIISTELYAVVRSADRQGLAPDEEKIIAIKEGNRNYTTFLWNYFPNWHPVYYKDADASLEAVSQGSADCALVSNYRLNRINKLCTQHKLSTLATGESVELSFAVRRDDNNLFTIINKLIRVVPKRLIYSSLTEHAFFDTRITFADYLKDNFAPALATISVITCAILLLILSNVRAEMKASERRQLISEAEHDRLTNLYSRNFFFAYASRICHEHPNTPYDAIIINIERFHALNTLNGRAFGDDVLRTLGAEITEFLKETNGIAARLEGDHFDIYCEPQEDYAALLDRFQNTMNEKFRTVDIRLRMGVMPWQEGLEPEVMFDLARSACSMVRGNLKSPLMVYNEQIRRRDDMEQRLQNDFVSALEKHQLEVYYQPKYDIQSQPPRLNSAEALIRWNHPELGLLSPSDFVPLFERSGQISELDVYVWTEVARQMAVWRDQYGVSLPVSVNISRVDVFNPNFINTLENIVEKNGLDRRDFHLEVTESAYTENAEQLIHIIGQLREKGYVIEMDDFGSGYSSLNMLSSMPIDMLKMDMAFIQNIGYSERDFHLVELILDIAHCLNVPVIAEGVETAQQLNLLRDAGCALVQGYYFSRPLPAQEFEWKILGKKAK